MVKLLNNKLLLHLALGLCVGFLHGAADAPSATEPLHEQTTRPGFTEEAETSAKNWSFNASYLEKYYPKAYVIRSCFFEKMTAAQVAQALDSIIQVLAVSPWFYFVDKPEAINVALYWEHIVDQCSLISDFLKKARVAKDTGMVFLPTRLDGDDHGGHFTVFLAECQAQEYEQSVSLLQHWRLGGVMSAYNFYALCFDYVIKLFNEGFLLNDFKQVQRYFFEMEFLAARLALSYYEAPYQEAMKNAKELMTLYKTKYIVHDVMHATGLPHAL